MNDLLTQLRERIPFTLAVAATTLWAVMAVMFIRNFGGITALMVLQPADLAVLVAAIFGPPAALWLFVAVLEQRRATHHFMRRMAEMMMQNRQSLQQTESQTRTLMQLQHQSARAQAIETRRMALQDMAASTSVLAERLGVMNREMANSAWARYGAGDVNVFVQSFLSFAISHPDISERMAEAVVRDPVAGAALAAFVRRYERLAAASSDDKMAVEIFDDGALGRAYRLFKTADELAQRMMARPAQQPAQQPVQQPVHHHAQQPAPQPVHHAAPPPVAQAVAAVATLKAEVAKAEVAKAEAVKAEPPKPEPVKAETPKPTVQRAPPAEFDLFGPVEGSVDADVAHRRLNGLAERLEAAAPPV